MTVTISQPNVQGERTFTFTKSAPSQKMLDTGEKAGRYLFSVGYGDHGTPEAPKTFDDLTNAQKLRILDVYIGQVLRDAAHTFHVNDAVETARAAAESTGDFDLGLLAKP